MPNYLDILQQFKDRNRVSTTYNPVNPYSSAGYTGFDAKEALKSAQQEALSKTDIIPEDVYKKPTTLEKGISAYQNVSQAGKLTGNKQIFGGQEFYTEADKLAGTIPTGKGIGDIKTRGGLLTALDAGIKGTGAYQNIMGTPAVAATEAVGTAGQAGYVAAAPPVAAAPTPYATSMAGMKPLPGSNLNAGTAGVLGSIAYSLANDKNPYTYGTGEALGMGAGDYLSTQAVMTAMPALSAAAPWLPIAAAGLGYLFRSGKQKKMKRKQGEYNRDIRQSYEGYISDARSKHAAESLAQRRQTGNTVYGGYAASQGMKYSKYKYNTGGNLKNDVIAEFTGNELVVNDQNVVEQGLKEKNYSKAAAPIRKAMRGGRITPGVETHKNNPMPVDKEGTIYAGGGPLSFRVRHGAGIYDHASEQFKSTMSDKEIALAAQKNINKWKSNNMYS